MQSSTIPKTTTFKLERSVVHETGTSDNGHGLEINATGNLKRFCPLHFGNLPLKAMIDTGADKSLISAESYSQIKSKFRLEKKPFRLRLKGVTGHCLKASHSAVLRFRIGKLVLKHEFIIVDGLHHDIMLGIDFLTKQKARLDFEKRTMIIGKHVTVLKTQNKTFDISVARTKQKGYLEPHSYTLVKLRMNKPLRKPCVVVPLDTSSVFYLQPGVSAPRIVLKNNKHLVIPIVNETSHRLT